MPCAIGSTNAQTPCTPLSFYKGGSSWRGHLEQDLGNNAGVRAILDSHDDGSLQELMTNLAGHDIEAVLEAFDEATLSDEPTCFIAYTIKGFGLPFAGHQENHAGLLNPEEVENLRGTMGIEPGREWDKFAGLSVDKEELQAFIASAPFSQAGTGAHDARVSRCLRSCQCSKRSRSRPRMRSVESCSTSRAASPTWRGR